MCCVYVWLCMAVQFVLRTQALELDGVWITFLSFASCVISGKLFSHFVAPFLHPLSGDNENAYLVGLL